MREYHEWTSEMGLTCLAIREGAYPNHWRGYVVLPEGHFFYKKRYDTCIKPNPCLDENGELKLYCEHTAVAILKVHGGITYAGPCDLENMPNYDWMLGFDCAHAGNLTASQPRGIYRDLDYVIDECEQLAEQLV